MITAPRRFAAAFGVAAILTLSTFAASAIAAGPTFYFSGRGYGHGVGMSQYGARGLSTKVDPATGKNYTAAGIIRYYYGNSSRTAVEARPAKNVRVRLDPKASSANGSFTRPLWTLRAGHVSARLKVSAGNLPTATTLPADHWYEFRAASAGITIWDASTTPKKRISLGGVSTFTGTVTAYETGASPQLVQVMEPTGLYGKTFNRYRGRMLISANGANAKLLNELSIENYLYGVVPREMPAEWALKTPAALAAQAIAARSFAYPTTGELWCTTYSQAYQGHSAGEDRSRPNYDVGEHSLSNKAVDSTRAQLAIYHWPSGTNEIIKTYFFDTSGGHTANIEDVWLTSDPKPFYVGVPDPDDSSSSHATWGAPKTFDGSSLGGLVRAWYGEGKQSRPYPAYITALSVNRAPNSGWVRMVTITWSDGQQTLSPGATFRSIIGVKSNKFSIGTNKAVAPPSVKEYVDGPRRFQDTDARIVHVGPWASASRASFSGGTHHATDAAQARFVAAFTGSGVNWVATKGPSCGFADVYIDGARVKTVDLYSASSAYRATVARIGGLPAGSHRLEIVPTGRKRSAARGAWVTVDAIDVVGDGLAQASRPVTSHDDTTRLLARTGSWSVQTSSTVLFNGTQTWTNGSSPSQFFATFRGTGMTWLGSQSPAYGSAKVFVDGVEKATVDCGSGTTHTQAPLWTIAGLPWGTHTVRIVPQGGTPAADRTDTRVSVDAIQVADGSLVQATPPAQTMQQDAAQLEYTGVWKTVAGTGYSGGSQAVSSAKDATLRAYFDGNGVTFSGTRGPKGGRAAVYVDGVLKATIDLYSAVTTPKQRLFISTGLPSGEHVAKVVVLGTRSAKSAGTEVSVDTVSAYGEILSSAP